MVVTLSGMVMLVSPVQSAKVMVSMVVTLFGIITLASPVQPEKALRPILVRLWFFLFTNLILLF